MGHPFYGTGRAGRRRARKKRGNLRFLSLLRKNWDSLTAIYRTCILLNGLCSGLKSSCFWSTQSVQVKKFKHHCQRPLLDTSTHHITETYLNWIHIVGNDNELGLLVLHQSCDSVHTCRGRQVQRKWDWKWSANAPTHTSRVTVAGAQG